MEGHQNPKPSLLQMNSNMELQFGSLDGIMPFHDQIPIGPNVPMFDPMAHFFSSGYNMNMGPEPELMGNSSPEIGFLGPTRVSKKHQEEVFFLIII